MEFDDVNDKVYNILMKEYNSSHGLGWAYFINNKNLGIKYKNTYYVGDRRDRVACVYKITDQKKWFLTKIKYGI